MKLNLTISKEKTAMRKLSRFAAIGALMLMVSLIAGRSSAQLFNFTPYPIISDNESDYYPDAQFLVPDALPGGQRYFLIPIFITNRVDPSQNPNTHDGNPPGPGGRIFGVDGQLLEPIRSFQFQVEYPNQAIELDQDPAHGSPIMTVGPTKNSPTENSLAQSFYIHWSEQSANDPSNPFNRVVRVAGASEIPLPLTPPGDSSSVLCYLRFHIIPNWTVNVAILQLDSAKFNDHVGDPQYDINNYLRGNLGGDRSTIRGRLPVLITAQPVIELRPLDLFSTTDGKNLVLLRPFIVDPADPGSNYTVTALTIDDAQGSSRITNLSVVTDEPWLSVGPGAAGGFGAPNPPSGQKPFFIASITNFNTQSQIVFDSKAMFITVDASKTPGPGVYIGYVTMTSDGASNSPVRIKVTLIVRARPNEPSPGVGTGIRLHLINSCSPQCTSTISFGTGSSDLTMPDASAGVDILYGEDLFTQADAAAALANPNAANQCYAFFEPLDRSVDPAFADPNVLGTTRDFRSRNSVGTLLYKVDFNTGGPLCYPLSVCFDPTDLPQGSRFIIRDVLNGSIFSFDMNQATNIVGGMRCITIRDANVNSFIIEYTPGGQRRNVAALQPRSWNFISLPVMVTDTKASDIFPNAVGTPLSYASNNGWTPAPDLQFGYGYFVRYSTILDGEVTGSLSQTVGDVQEVRVHEGWNAVGAASFPTCIETSLTGISPQTVFLSPVPGGPPLPDFATDNSFWEYTPGHGYNQATYLLPGHGYFCRVNGEADYHVRVNASCKAVAEPNAELKASLVKVSVSDAAQNSQDLYFGTAVNAQDKKAFEMPPSFTDFDARLVSTNGMIAPTGDQQTVKISSENYPVALNFSNVGGTVEVRDLTGNLLGEAVGNGSVVIRNASVKSVIISLKGASGSAVSGYSLDANYPNPFGQITSIGYSVPAETFVTITVTNALGQVVATPVSEVVAPGAHAAAFDASKLAEGTYFYTIHAGSFTQTEKMTVTR